MKMPSVFKRLVPAVFGLVAGIVLVAGPSHAQPTATSTDTGVVVDLHVAKFPGDIDWP